MFFEEPTDVPPNFKTFIFFFYADLLEKLLFCIKTIVAHSLGDEFILYNG